jgi:hypothetical protein
MMHTKFEGISNWEDIRARYVGLFIKGQNVSFLQERPAMSSAMNFMVDLQ